MSTSMSETTNASWQYLWVGCVMNFPDRRALNVLIALLVDVTVSLDFFSKSENGNIYPYWNSSNCVKNGMVLVNLFDVFECEWENDYFIVAVDFSFDIDILSSSDFIKPIKDLKFYDSITNLSSVYARAITFHMRVSLNTIYTPRVSKLLSKRKFSVRKNCDFSQFELKSAVLTYCYESDGRYLSF